jgi:hypothetical protein
VGSTMTNKLLVVSHKVSAPPMAMLWKGGVEPKFSVVKHWEFETVAVPVNAKFCPSVMLAVIVGAMVNGAVAEFTDPEYVPDNEAACLAVHVPASSRVSV